MALKVADRIKENTSSTGVGGLSLTGAPAGFQRFSAILASGDTTYYSLEENDKFEVGIGTYGSDNLERTTVLSSSNSGSKISLGGSGVVFITYPADKSVYNNQLEQSVVGSSGVRFADGTIQTSASSSSYDDTYVSGVATYASGQSISNQSNISTNTSRVSYASGQAVANEVDIVAVSGIAAYASGVGGGDVTASQLNYVSGIAVYSSGQTAANQSSITALLTASGTATSLISSSE